MISTVVMHVQAQNRETINSTWKVAVSFKIIMTTSVTRPCFTTQHQTCKTKTDFLVSDQSCPKTEGLRSHHWPTGYTSLYTHTCNAHQSDTLSLSPQFGEFYTNG